MGRISNKENNIMPSREWKERYGIKPTLVKIQTSAGWANTGEWSECNHGSLAEALRDENEPSYRDVARGGEGFGNQKLVIKCSSGTLCLDWWQAKAAFEARAQSLDDDDDDN